jgi:hypothetical protein
VRAFAAGEYLRLEFALRREVLRFQVLGFQVLGFRFCVLGFAPAAGASSEVRVLAGSACPMRKGVKDARFLSQLLMRHRSAAVTPVESAKCI